MNSQFAGKVHTPSKLSNHLTLRVYQLQLVFFAFLQLDCRVYSARSVPAKREFLCLGILIGLDQEVQPFVGRKLLLKRTVESTNEQEQVFESDRHWFGLAVSGSYSNFQDA
jgi:hypothetical protein